jgi:HicB_like antitoxin of bacterial toxin-antitoxin system
MREALCLRLPRSKLCARLDDTGWAFGVITVDPAALDCSVERVNVTLPRRVLLRLDAQARASGESRSGYLAHLTMEGGRGEHV